MENLHEKFKKMRHDPTIHLGLGDIRLTLSEQEDILQSAPISIAQKYARWKEKHPNEDYQYDEIMEFVSSLTRGDMVDVMEFLLRFA